MGASVAHPFSDHQVRVTCALFLSLALSLGLNLANPLTTQVLGESMAWWPTWGFFLLSEVSDEMVLQEAWKQISSGRVKATSFQAPRDTSWQLKFPTA